MPPAVFIAQSIGYDVGVAMLEFIVPTSAKKGDTLIAVIACGNTTTGIDAEASMTPGWEFVASFPDAVTGWGVVIARREQLEGDDAVQGLTLSSNPSRLYCGLLVYRALEPSAAVVASSPSAARVLTSIDIPSLVLTAYSDLYLAAFTLSGGATNPARAGYVTRFSGTSGGGAMLWVGEYLPGVSGATGVETFTVDAADTFGGAAVLACRPPIIAPSVTPDVSGAIGFVSVGV